MADDSRLKLFYHMQLREVLEGKNRFSSRYENQVGIHNFTILFMMVLSYMYFIFSINFKLMRYGLQDGNTVKELEDCRNMNSKLMRYLINCCTLA